MNSSFYDFWNHTLMVLVMMSVSVCRIKSKDIAEKRNIEYFWD